MSNYMWGYNNPLNLLAFGFFMFSLICILGLALYIYVASALMTIAKKLNHPTPWLAWIPFANIALILQLGEFHWAWVFLLLIPFVGWLAIYIMSIISFWKIYLSRNYPGWLSLIPLFVFIPMLGALAVVAHLIILGLVAWREAAEVERFMSPKKATNKKSSKVKKK